MIWTFRKLKCSKLNVDKEIYKACNKSRKLILPKEESTLIQIKRNIVKLEDFWKTLNQLRLSKNFSVVQTNAIEDNKYLKYNVKSVGQTFCKILF